MNSDTVYIKTTSLQFFCTVGVAVCLRSHRPTSRVILRFTVFLLYFSVFVYFFAHIFKTARSAFAQ